MKLFVSLIVALSVVILGLASTATAQVPNQMQYQGFLTDKGGSPLDTTVSMYFAIYEDPTGPIECGCTIWSNTVLEYDLLDCPAKGITIGADGITLDGNGHVIDGAGSGKGIDLENRHNVTIKDCEVREFSTGIYLAASSNDTLIDNTVSDNECGIDLLNSYSNTLTNNTASSNSCNGIRIQFVGSYDNTLTGNTAFDNGQEGIYLHRCDNNTLMSNTANHSSYGIRVEFGSNNTLMNNTADSNVYGIVLSISSGNDLINNTANHNGQTGIGLFASDNNTVFGNTAEGNAQDGIRLHRVYLHGGSDSNLVSGNVFAGNDLCGARLVDNARYNTLWNNDFVDNGVNARESMATSNSNAWCLGDTGNSWSDCLDNPGMPDYYEIPGPGDGIDFYPNCLILHGDANGDGEVEVGDVLVLIDYLYRGGDPPNPFLAGDATCDDDVSVDDVVYLINYIFRDGPPPPGWRCNL